MVEGQIRHYRIMRKILIIFIIFFAGFSLGFLFNYFIQPPFEKLSVEKMQSKVVEYLNLAIKKSEDKGIYNCCVEPACTMCFLEQNTWNGQKAGRCNCADFIRQGKEPCPQCKKILSIRKQNE